MGGSLASTSFTARDATEVIELVAKTPCLNAGGAIEVWQVQEPEPRGPEEH
jgi:hypothetical protein